jgi:beta-lactam-binding protein with PASTA domain
LTVLEKQQLQVIATGKGKVTAQSILPGTAIQRGQTIYLTLGNSID